MKTRAFKSGNSQAVRIPAEIAYADTDADLEITRHGDTILISPAAAVADMKAMIKELQRTPAPPFEPVERTRPRKTLWDED